jgi:hypothetical protein
MAAAGTVLGDKMIMLIAFRLPISACSLPRVAPGLAIRGNWDYGLIAASGYYGVHLAAFGDCS